MSRFFRLRVWGLGFSFRVSSEFGVHKMAGNTGRIMDACCCYPN